MRRLKKQHNTHQTTHQKTFKLSSDRCIRTRIFEPTQHNQATQPSTSLVANALLQREQGSQSPLNSWRQEISHQGIPLLHSGMQQGRTLLESKVTPRWSTSFHPPPPLQLHTNVFLSGTSDHPLSRFPQADVMALLGHSCASWEVLLLPLHPSQLPMW